jgi:hypothetical protein
VVRDKIRHYRQIYLDRPDPIAFMTVAVDTSGHVYDDFIRLLFLHTHREASPLAKELEYFVRVVTKDKRTGKNGPEFLIGWRDFPVLVNYFVISYF